MWLNADSGGGSDGGQEKGGWGGLKGVSSWHSLGNWNGQSEKEQRKVKQSASTAATERELDEAEEADEVV